MPKVIYKNREGGGGIIPEGKVALQVIEDEYTVEKYSSNGNPMLSLKMRQVGVYNEDTREWERQSGGTLFETLTFTEKAMWRIDGFINSAGLAAAEGEEIDLDVDKCIGKVVYCEVVHTKQDNDRYPVKPEVHSYIKVQSQFHPRNASLHEEPPIGGAPSENDDLPDDCPF